MALEPCPECGAQKSSKATTCPHCGYVFKSIVRQLLSAIVWFYVPALDDKIKKIIQFVRQLDDRLKEEAQFRAKVEPQIAYLSEQVSPRWLQ